MMRLSENQKSLASNLPPTPTQNVPDKWLKMAQNTKGGPLDEKIFFSKKFSDLHHSRLIFSDFPHWFQKHIYRYSILHARPIFTPCTLRVPCTKAKKGVLGSKSSDIYVFGISEKNLKKLDCYGQNLKTVLKQKYFFVQGTLWFFCDLYQIFTKLAVGKFENRDIKVSAIL